MESIFFVVLTEFFSMNMAYSSKLIKKKMFDLAEEANEE